MSDENKPMLDMSGDDYDHAQGSVEPQPEEEVNSEPAGAYVPDHSTVPIDEDSGYDDPLVKPPAVAEGSEPLMSPGMAAAWFGGCFVLFLIGWFCHSFSAIPNLILALLFTTASLTVFRSLKVKRWVLHTCLLVGISVVYLFGLFLFHKVWLDSFSNFGEHVVGLTRKAGDAVSSGSAEDVKAVKVPVKIAGDSIIAAKGFLAISAKNKFKMWAQLVFFSASIFLFSLTVIHATPGLGRPVTGSEKGFMTWFGPTAHRCTSAIGAFALARIIKAIVICMICGIGLRMASVPLGPFIAGTVFCFALVSYLSPAVALVLGSIAIWAVGWSWSALGGLLVVCVVLGLAEKALFWVLKRIPLFRAYVVGPSEGSGAVGKTMGTISRLMPHVFSLGVLALLVFFVYTVYDVYTQSQTRDGELKKAENLFETEDWQGAFDAYTKLLDNYPDHPGDAQVVVSMLKCRLKQDRLDKAGYIAGVLAEWPEDEGMPDFSKITDADGAKAGGASLVAKFRYEMHGFLSTQGRVKPGKGYELIIRNLVSRDRTEFVGEESAELHGEVGEKLMALDEENPWGYVGAGYAAIAKGDGDRAMALARSGLSREPKMPELILLQAEAYFSSGQFDECIERCKVLLKPEDMRDGEINDHAVKLLAQAAAARSEADQAPEEGGGDAPVENGDTEPETE